MDHEEGRVGGAFALSVGMPGRAGLSRSKTESATDEHREKQTEEGTTKPPCRAPALRSLGRDPSAPGIQPVQRGRYPLLVRALWPPRGAMFFFVVLVVRSMRLRNEPGS